MTIHHWTWHYPELGCYLCSGIGVFATKIIPPRKCKYCRGNGKMPIPLSEIL